MASNYTTDELRRVMHPSDPAYPGRRTEAKPPMTADDCQRAAKTLAWYARFDEEHRQWKQQQEKKPCA